jgi:hypothetical protein
MRPFNVRAADGLIAEGEGGNDGRSDAVSVVCQ